MNAIAKAGIVILVVLAIILSIVYFSTRQKNTLTTRMMRVGHVADFPPFWFKKGNENGDFGLDRDLIKLVLGELGVTKIDYIDFPSFEALYEGLKNNQIDIAVSDLWPTTARKKEFDFTIPYYYHGGLAMTFKKGQENIFRTGKDLDGKTVGLLEGGDDKSWLPNYNYKAIKKYNTRKELIYALLNGEVDVVVEDYGILNSVHSLSNGKTNTILFLPLEGTFGLRKTDTLLKKQLDAVLKTLWNDHSLYWIKSRYLPEYQIEPFNYSPYR